MFSDYTEYYEALDWEGQYIENENTRLEAENEAAKEEKEE
ncbi:hypothetical protein kuro4_00960 [Gelria sp. Kuro-4]|nr:hypothetical protein kuro4_00960 [Gelria sp. Kuro-4]